MKKTRLKDVLDNKVFNKEKWDMIIGKLKKLGTAIEMFKGPEMSIDDSASLAIAAINLKSEMKSGVKHIKMAKVSEQVKTLEMVSDSDLEKYDQAAKGKFTK